MLTVTNCLQVPLKMWPRTVSISHKRDLLLTQLGDNTTISQPPPFLNEAHRSDALQSHSALIYSYPHPGVIRKPLKAPLLEERSCDMETRLFSPVPRDLAVMVT